AGGGAVSAVAAHGARAGARLPCSRASSRYARRQHAHFIEPGFGGGNSAAVSGNVQGTRRRPIADFPVMKIDAGGEKSPQFFGDKKSCAVRAEFALRRPRIPF